MTTVLGVSGDFHDAAAAVVVDGRVVAAAQEERFTRVKHDPGPPRNAIRWCLGAASVEPDDLDRVVFYEKPFTTYERILSTHAQVGPKGFRSLRRAAVNWSRSKLWTAQRLDRLLRGLGFPGARVAFAEHHQSHAASAYYPSPFETAVVITIDGVGEWATTTISHGSGRHLRPLCELRFPDSLGLFYSAVTAFCGFDVNDGEYKLMGLAPYGSPRFVESLRRVIDIRSDGSVRLDQRWFDYRTGSRMYSPQMAQLLGGPPARRGEPPGEREADIARSAQVLLEEAVLRIAQHAHTLTGERRACLAGGVALNCVANSRLLTDGPFEEIWVQPAAGDAGGSIGAALWWYHQVHGSPRRPQRPDGMSGAALGPEYGPEEVLGLLDRIGIDHRQWAGSQALVDHVARVIAEGGIVGWVEGRSEFGPRALGHRSILADPRRVESIAKLNESVKQRDGFRPFAPAVLAERASEWFELDRPSPYMLFTVPVASARRVASDAHVRYDDFTGRLQQVRSQIPACTHVDHSARVQTVDRAISPAFHGLLSAFERLTGCPVLVNTSFNRSGEPIVETPEDAVSCACAAGLDLLVIGTITVSGTALQRRSHVLASGVR